MFALVQTTLFTLCINLRGVIEITGYIFTKQLQRKVTGKTIPAIKYLFETWVMKIDKTRDMKGKWLGRLMSYNQWSLN